MDTGSTMHWGVMQDQVATIDINALEKLVDFISANGHPIVVIFSYGTTLKGGCDDVKTG